MTYERIQGTVVVMTLHEGGATTQEPLPDVLDELNMLAGIVVTLQARVDAADRVFDYYDVQHQVGCVWPFRPGNHVPQEDYPCVCGLNDALQEVAEGAEGKDDEPAT